VFCDKNIFINKKNIRIENNIFLLFLSLKHKRKHKIIVPTHKYKVSILRSEKNHNEEIKTKTPRKTLKLFIQAPGLGKSLKEFLKIIGKR
tara:strand:- start:54 stop:323 length:270 start_codon:yes stop_codon:yes gene_type:complete